MNTKIIFKYLITRLFFNGVVGRIVKFKYGDFVPLFLYKSDNRVRVYFDLKTTDYPTVCRLFFNSYERHERNLFKKHFQGSEFILELGASLGVMSLEALCSFPNSKLVAVECNESLIENLHKTIKAFSNTANYELIQAFVPFSYDESFEFQFTNSLSGKITTVYEPSTKTIVDLDTILHEKFRSRPYSLISDIEGAEYYFIFERPRLLDRCVELCIELHPVTVNGRNVSVKMFTQRLSELGFSQIDQSQRAFYFKKLDYINNAAQG